MHIKTEAEKELEKDLTGLMSDYREGKITVEQFMKLAEITYRDFMEFNPGEKQRLIGGDYAF